MDVTSWFYYVLEMPLLLLAWLYGMFVNGIARARPNLVMPDVRVKGVDYVEKESTEKTEYPSMKPSGDELTHSEAAPLPSSEPEPYRTVAAASNISNNEQVHSESRPPVSEQQPSRAVLEASLARPEKHLMSVRGILWDVSPPFPGARADSFNIMLHCLYFPSNVDWSFDVSVKGSVRCQWDSNAVLELSEVKAKLSNEESTIKLTFNKSESGLSDKQWKHLDRFKIEITVENFEGYRDPTPSQFVINVEEPAIKHDRVLIVEGRKIYVQSKILSLWLAHFASMFNSRGETDKQEIIIDDVKAEEFIEMLHAMYTSNKPVTVDSLDSLLDLAARFKMVNLGIKCGYVIANAPKGTFDSSQMIRFTRKYRPLAQETAGGRGDFLDTELLSNGHLNWKSKQLRPNFEKPSVAHDRVITIGKRRFHVLSALLAARSSYFASLFDSRDDPEKAIPLSNVSADEFIALLHAIYPSEIVEDRTFPTLLRLAKWFEIPWLTARCSLYLCTLERRGMSLMPLVKLSFEYKLDQVKSWLFAKASRELHGCVYLFMQKNADELSSQTREIQQFFQRVRHDWQYISCPTGSECLPRPEMKYRINLSAIPPGTCYYVSSESDSISITPV